MANKNTTTNTTAADILVLADDATMQTAVAYHDMWELAKAELSRDDQAYIWAELSSRSVERKIGHFAGKKFFRAHPEYTPSTPAWAGKSKAPAKADPNPPAKQEKRKPKAEVPAPKAPEEPKPAKAKDPTTKQLLAAMTAALVNMDARNQEAAKRLDTIESTLVGINAELAGAGKRLAAIEKKLAK
ncbi:MAG: hypothetical protein J6Y20_08900 [Lachnospiraceae bacterium]|nr:hypothetical protein [Lachnospiraceae bacterium]